VTTANQVTHFVKAARRHFDDASHLYVHQRLPSADHLAGFAAECALKVILLQFLGAYLNTRGKLASLVNQQEVLHGHLPALWNQLPLVASGRSGARFAALIAQSNPFMHWRAEDRYLDGSHITGTQVDGHLKAAKDVLLLQQQA
jgi:hypothetical protein